jgi:hypothetical protein
MIFAIVVRATRWPRFRSAPCPRIAPPRVLRRRPENELANLALHARSAGPPFPAAPRLRDQFAMPAEDRVRCHQRRDVAKGAPADLVAEHSQSPTLIIGQSNAMAEQLRLQGPVLFAKKIDDRTLLTLDPSKERHEQEVERKHAPESIRNSIHLPHAAGTNLGNNFIRAEARPGSQQHDDRLGRYG